MGKSKPQTSTVETTLPAESKPYLYGDRGILPRAQALSQQPLNLPDYQVAGFSAPQKQAFNVAQSGIGGYMPALSQGMGAMRGGIGATGQAMGIVPAALQGAQPYQTAAARGTMGAVQSAQPYQAGSAAMGFGSTQGYNPMSGYQGFMNPYMEEVVRQSESDIARQGDIQAQGIRSQSVGQGAFGGSRQAVAERELGRNIADQQARTSSGLRAQGFEQAQANALSAFEQQQQRQGQFAQLLGNLGTAYGQLGLQGAGQMADIGTAYGQLGLQGAQTLGNLGQGLGSLGTQMAGLGELGQQLNIRDVGTLMDIGNVQQGQAQAGLDALRQNRYQRTMAPYQQLGFFSDIFQGLPVGQSQTTTAPGPNPTTQVAGTIYGISQLAKS
jgi:hypothetical protein